MYMWCFFACSLVQRETIEGDGEDGGDIGDDGADGWEEDGGDSAAAAAAAAAAKDGSSLSRNSGSGGSQEGDSRRHPPRSSLPANPLEDTEAVERWLQQVQLLQQQQQDQDSDAAAASVEPNKGEEDAAPDGGEETPQLQRGQLCQQDEARGTHEAFAEAEENSASQSTNNAKLAETDTL